MEITLKKVKKYSALSEETIAYTADVYIDGILIGTAQNNGKGGETYVQLCQKANLEKLREAEKWASNLPAKKIMGYNGEFEYKQNLSSVIDDALEEHELAKQCKKHTFFYVAEKGWLQIKNQPINEEIVKFVLTKYENAKFPAQYKKMFEYLRN